MMMMKSTAPNATLGALVVGAGWVSTQHIAAYASNPRTRVAAVYNRRVETARARLAEAGLDPALATDDLDAALARSDVDVVSICTPQHVHAANVVAAAAAGKPMLIEKPLGNSREELYAMRDAVKAAGVTTVVGFVLRWNPLFQTLKAMLADGAFGRPYYVEADYLSHNGSWWSGWNDARTLERGVSAMLVGGCHAVDAMRWFACEQEHQAATPVEVTAVSGGYRKGLHREYQPASHSWIDDAPPMEYDGLEVALVQFDNGALGKVSVNADCIMPYRFPLRIFGDRGSVFDDRVYSHKFPGQNDWVRLPAIGPGSSDVSHHPFQAEIDHFVDCVETGRASHCDLDDAILTHEIVFAARDSARTRRPVSLVKDA